MDSWAPFIITPMIQYSTFLLTGIDRRRPDPTGSDRTFSSVAYSMTRWFGSVEFSMVRTFHFPTGYIISHELCSVVFGYVRLRSVVFGLLLSSGSIRLEIYRSEPNRFNPGCEVYLYQTDRKASKSMDADQMIWRRNMPYLWIRACS